MLFTKGIAECFPGCVRSAGKGNISACVTGGTEALAITIKEGISKYRYNAAHSEKKGGGMREWGEGEDRKLRTVILEGAFLYRNSKGNSDI